MVRTQTEGRSYHWVIRYVGEPAECCPQSPVEIILQTLVSLNSRAAIVSWWVCVLKLNITSRLNKTLCISWHFFSAVGVENMVIWLVVWWHTLDSQIMVTANLLISYSVSFQLRRQKGLLRALFAYGRRQRQRFFFPSFIGTHVPYYQWV